MGRAIIFLLLCPALAWADTLYLNDGQTVTGEIIAETEDGVRLKERVGASGYAEARYPRARIARIERGPTERSEPPAQIAATPSTTPSAATGQSAEQVLTEAANAAVAVIQQGTEELRRQTATGQIANLSLALESYKAVGGAYPTTQEGLQALLVQPPGDALWMGPYVDSPPRDPWGRPYRYVCPGRHGAFDLFSIGADGAEGTEDDVTSW